MRGNHKFVKANRTPEETAKLKAERERYQSDKPTPEQLLAESGQEEFTTLGELLELHALLFALKKERERQGLTLAQLSELTGIEQAALSRLENGKNDNPTFGTIQRIGKALNKQIRLAVVDSPIPVVQPA